jgi:hypothetical protein
MNNTVLDDSIEDVVPEEANEEHEDSMEEEDLKEFLGLDDEDEDEDDDGMDNGIPVEEQNPAVMKLNEKIKLLSHRCSAGLGNSLFDKTLQWLKQN